MSILIFSLWGIQIAAKLATAAKLAHAGMARRWWGIVLWCLATAAKSLYLVYRYNVSGKRGYAAALEALQLVDYAAGVLLVGFVCWRVAQHFADAYKVWGVLAAYAAMAAAIALSTTGLLAPDGAPYAAFHMIARQWNLATLLVCLAAFALYDGPLTVNSRIAKWGLLAFTTGEFVANFGLRMNWVAPGQLVTVMGPIVAVAAWSLISEGGEGQPSPDPLHGSEGRRLSRWSFLSTR